MYIWFLIDNTYKGIKMKNARKQTKMLNRYLKTNTIRKPTMLIKHYNDVVGIELNTKSAIKEIVRGRLLVAPLNRVSGYSWVDSDLTIYHRDDSTTVIEMCDQPPSLRNKVRRAAAISFFGKVLSSYRTIKLDTPSVLSLIPSTHDWYSGDLLLKPGAVNLHFDPLGENIELPIYYKDGIVFSKHTVRKRVLERKPFKVQYKNRKYELSFRDIMYQVLDFRYYSRTLLYRYDDDKPFTIDNCILISDDSHNSYDNNLMLGGN